MDFRPVLFAGTSPVLIVEFVEIAAPTNWAARARDFELEIHEIGVQRAAKGADDSRKLSRVGFWRENILVFEISSPRAQR